jgi:hypothetical protein
VTKAYPEMTVKLRRAATLAVAPPLVAIALMIFPGVGADAASSPCIATVTQASMGYPPSAQCSATTTKTTVPAGGQITIGGGGFVPGHVVTLTLHSAPVDLGTAVADAHGVVSATVTMPGDLKPGVHHITIFDKLTGRLLGVPVTVAGTTTTPPGSTAPNPTSNTGNGAIPRTSTNGKHATGTSHSALAIATVAGAVLLASAGAVVAVARRRVAG